ncbi:MAG: Gx transporter family protein [Negativicutes bacterium]|nr:Gx transporter family protein [Negativicutes bacterium]
MDTRRVVILGLFVAIAGVLHAVEGWLPLPVPVPGAKLGLANIVSLLAISMYGWRDALVVAVLRVVLGSLLGGTFLGPAFAMSMSGALISAVGMAFAYRYLRPMFSLVGISIIGAVLHNLAQIAVAATLVASPGLFWYLPYLLLFALPTGVATGLTTIFFLSKLPRGDTEKFRK